MKSLYYKYNTKMADIIHADYKLLLILPRFGINLGFGDKTIKECCESHGVSTELFLMICNVYSHEEYLPTQEEINNVDAFQLLNYLKKSHIYYSQQRLISIEEQLDLISSSCEDQHKKILKQFFDGYKTEVQNHFEYEEKVVFPYISCVVKGVQIEDYTIKMFEENHSDIDEKLNDLKNIIIKYLQCGAYEWEKTHVLFEIFLLEDDLAKHSLIEDKILIPLVMKLEQQYGNKL